jgi:hypothetical protein
MVRHRLHVVFVLGRFNDGVEWAKELNAASRSAGLVEGRLWSPGFGQTNECVMEWDYPDLATLESERDTFWSTAETMRVFRKGIELQSPNHWPWDEVLVEAPTLA